MPRPILVAVDFSDLSAEAFRWASALAKRLETSLVALHVVHDPLAAGGSAPRPKKHSRHLRRIEDEASERFESFLARVRAEDPLIDGRLEHRLEVGLPTSRILEVAKRVDAQLIVVGSHGRTGLPRLLLGSKAQKVAQLSPVPVTVVKSAGAGPG